MMKKYCYIQNGQVQHTVDVLPTNWKNISNLYVLPDAELIKLGWLPVQEQPYAGTLSEGYHVQPTCVLHIQAEESSAAPEISQTPEQDMLQQSWMHIRSQRDALLAASDKLMLLDVFEQFSDHKQQQIKLYRQQLRDIPQTYLHPDGVIWPTELWV